MADANSDGDEVSSFVKVAAAPASLCLIEDFSFLLAPLAPGSVWIRLKGLCLQVWWTFEHWDSDA